MLLATKRVVAPTTEENPLGFIVINASDFDPNTMQDFDAAPAKTDDGKEDGGKAAKGSK